MAEARASKKKGVPRGKKSFLEEKSHYIAGAAAALLLLVFYIAILTIANSFSHAVTELLDMWYFILPLSLGFGTQAGLYFYVKKFLAEKAAAASVAGAGGMSGASMVACCAHHLTDFLPILGLSAFAIFLDKYQATFILIALFSNMLGTIYMLSVIKKHGLYDKSGNGFTRLLSLDLDRAFKTVFSVGLALTALSIIYAFSYAN